MTDIATSGGYLNMTPSQREKYEEIRRSPESFERAKLLAPESTSDLSTDDLLQPQSDISIRNRYLSRIGGMVIFSFCSINIFFFKDDYLTKNIMLIIFLLFLGTT